MIDIEEIFQFKLAKNACMVSIRSGEQMTDEWSSVLLDSIIKVGRDENCLQEIIESDKMAALTILIAARTTTTGIVTLFERLKRINAYDIQLALVAEFKRAAMIANDYNYLLPGVESVMHLVL